MIGIIDYGVGNLRSVQKAFEHVGARAVIVTDAANFGAMDRLVLPGVGAFADGMGYLRERGFVEPVKAYIATGKPLLGICLGMQLLFDGSEEDAPSPQQLVPGLGVLGGAVRRFHEDAGGGRMKVPHMGWNSITWQGEQPLFAGLEPGAHVYFVHGYYCLADDVSAVAATCDYGVSFCAAAHVENVYATQFHPEKSQRNGLRMLENFASL